MSDQSGGAPVEQGKSGTPDSKTVSSDGLQDGDKNSVPTIAIEKTIEYPECPEQDPAKPQRDGFDRANIILLTLTFLAAGIATAAAIYAAAYTGRQVQIARDTLEVTKNTASAQIRAYMFPKPLPQVWALEGTPEIWVYFRNAGQTPAYDFSAWGQIDVLNTAPAPVETVFRSGAPQKQEPVVDPSTDITDGMLLRLKRGLTDSTRAAIGSGNQTRLFIWGVTSYRDVFGKLHNAYFCYAFWGHFRPGSGAPQNQRGLRTNSRSSCDTPASD